MLTRKMFASKVIFSVIFAALVVVGLLISQPKAQCGPYSDAIISADTAHLMHQVVKSGEAPTNICTIQRLAEWDNVHERVIGLGALTRHEVETRSPWRLERGSCKRGLDAVAVAQPGSAHDGSGTRMTFLGEQTTCSLTSDIAEFVILHGKGYFVYVDNNDPHKS